MKITIEVDADIDSDWAQGIILAIQSMLDLLPVNTAMGSTSD